MKTKRAAADPRRERGIVITLVALVMLFVVCAMAVLAIDLATFYTARSEAQLAADGAALAGARALANSGMTSSPADTNLVTDAKRIATSLALQVATDNAVGGRVLVGTVNCENEVCVTFPNDGLANFGSNPHVSVTVTREDLPTFFARIWGRNLVTVQATTVAEAYNPSGQNPNAGSTSPVVAPLCVKPWVLPNLSPDPLHTGPIFNPTTGAIQNASTLLGWTDPSTYPNFKFQARCTGNLCLNWTSLTPTAWQYYPGDPSSFPVPTQAVPSCSGNTPYQKTIAGCVTTPIACNQTVTLDQTPYNGRNRQTSHAVNCLTHSEDDNGDTVAVSPPNQAFQFLGGTDNPVQGAAGKNVLVSDSVVTVPVYNSATGVVPLSSVTVIGFVQLFLNPDGHSASEAAPARINTRIVNLVGCGTNSSGQPIYGNGPSALVVRLIHP